MLIHLFFTLLFVSERKQIAFMAAEKSPTRISQHLFATSRSEMRIIMNDKKHDDNLLGNMSIGRLFLKLAIPAVLSQLINILYNLVDKMFIGHMSNNGAKALAGMGVTIPVILAISAFAALVSMGGAPKASIMIGRKQNDMAEKIVGTCTFMLLIISFALTGIMLILGKDILLLFGASNDTIGYASDYMRIYCIGTVFIQLTLGLNSFITAQGYTKISMINVSIGACLNVLLDYVFIYILNMGIKGAALATVISQAISAMCVIRFLCYGKCEVHLRKKYIRFDGNLLISCILLGTSPALMQLTENIVAISFNTALQKYGGDMAVESMSILNSIMQFVMLLLPGLVQGAQPILSYNLGAGNISRVRKTFYYLLCSCLAGSFIIWSICMICPQNVAHIFTGNNELIKYSVKSMRIYLSMLCIYGIQVACQYSFVALDNAPVAIFLTIWRKIILLIPLIFILPHFISNRTMGVFWAEPIADTIAVCTTGYMFYKYFRRLGEKK